MMQPSNANFCHPYEPYSIQLEFMRELYRCIEDGNVGIFESPTGTGKSLSLICGSLTWLRDNNRRLLDETYGHKPSDPDDWLTQAEADIRRKEILREREELEEKLAKLRKGGVRGGRSDRVPTVPKRPRTDTAQEDEDFNDEDFILDDYDSNGEENTNAAVKSGGLSAATQALLAQLKPHPDRENTVAEVETKLIFCSRTHSQLTQFVHELRRVTPPSSTSSRPDNSQHSTEPVKHIPLGSRKNLCINEEVLRLSSSSAINERCLELQKPRTAKDHKCRYLPTKVDLELTGRFRDLAIARVYDIEDIAALGRHMHICPYYASRSAIPATEVLTLPYPLLLQKSARDALGVSIKDNIIIIDEAHNLMDAIANSFSASLEVSQLDAANEQLMTYVRRFKNNLKGKNRVYATQIIRLLNSITQCVRINDLGSEAHDIEVTPSQLMAGNGVDQIQPHKLAKYIQESKLAYKVEGYAEAHKQGQGSASRKNVLMDIQGFLIVLMNPSAEGRFFLSRQEGNMTIRYSLLDPREHFRDVVQDARAVILAGGTMSPMSDYTDYLFSYVPKSRLRTFSFGHIVPKENMYVQAITHGPKGQPLTFTFDKRSEEATVQDLGSLLVQVCHACPDGVVAFFPSYDYLAQILQAWKRSNLFGMLSRAKPVFEETKGIAVDDLLRDYAQSIDGGQGALLLSVVGGKLSEGINFSDKLGRAVIAVGLPFPNASSGEWKAKIAHVEELKRAQCMETQQMSEEQAQYQAKAAGRDFYENACMRAVNQSIGRAIRHRHDYAAILLVDRRFSTERIRRKLPGWIQESMTEESMPWQKTEAGLKAFFAGKQ